MAARAEQRTFLHVLPADVLEVEHQQAAHGGGVARALACAHHVRDQLHSLHHDLAVDAALEQQRDRVGGAGAHARVVGCELGHEDLQHVGDVVEVRQRIKEAAQAAHSHPATMTSPCRRDRDV